MNIAVYKNLVCYYNHYVYEDEYFGISNFFIKNFFTVLAKE